MAQTCALIAPVQPILYRVSCSNETLTNAPKHYENAPKHQFRFQWGGSCAFVAKKSDASSWHELLHLLHQFGLFRTEFHAVTKQSKIHPNTTKHTNSWVSRPMGWIRCVHREKFQRDFVAQTFHSLPQFGSFCTEFSAVTKRSQMHSNNTKMQQNMSFVSHGVYRVRS